MVTLRASVSAKYNGATVYGTTGTVGLPAQRYVYHWQQNVLSADSHSIVCQSNQACGRPSLALVRRSWRAVGQRQGHKVASHTARENSPLSDGSEYWQSTAVSRGCGDTRGRRRQLIGPRIWSTNFSSAASISGGGGCSAGRPLGASLSRSEITDLQNTVR